ncbi:Chitinase 4 [Linum grandiflorum]
MAIILNPIIAVVCSAIFLVAGGGLVDATRVSNVISPAFFHGIMDQTSSSCKGRAFYTRQSFLTAARSYHHFAKLASVDDSKREIAAFLAHVTHQTGHLCYVEQQTSQTYCNSSMRPCAPGKMYYSRGPLQLTWNYNYEACGWANRFDGLNNPDIVGRSPVVAWKTALWIWMRSVRPVLDQGFGATIRRLSDPDCNGGNPANVEARVSYYLDYCKHFGVTPGPNLSC